MVIPIYLSNLERSRKITPVTLGEILYCHLNSVHPDVVLVPAVKNTPSTRKNDANTRMKTYCLFICRMTKLTHYPIFLYASQTSNKE